MGFKTEFGLRRSRRLGGAVLFAGVCAMLAPVIVLAAPAPPSAIQQGEAIQRQQQQQIDQDQTRILTSPRGQTVIEVPTHAPAVAPKGSCQTISLITFLHAPDMSAKGRQRLIAPYIGRCLGLGDVENLLSDITRFYVDKGQPTTRVYIKPQNLKQGELALDVIEGKVERVVLDNHGAHSVNMTTAFAARPDMVFNLRVFEQGLDQINRLASNNATIDILPGDLPGQSIVRIRNTATFPLHLTLSYDNTGQPSTGRNQGSATVVADDLLHLNDQISYTRRQTVAEHKPNTDSASNSVLFTVPYNALTLTLGYNDSTYASQTVTAGGTVFKLTGTTRNIFGELDDVVWRDSRSKLDLSATLTDKHNRNYIDDTYLAVSSRNLTVLDLKADYTTLVGAGSLKLGFGYSRGLTAFNALKDPSGLADSAPRAQFDKLVASAYLSLPFKVAGRAYDFTSEIDGQYGFQPLYSSEQTVIGSPFTVRGFLKDSLVADRGVYAQNDVATVLRAVVFKQPVAFRPHVGVDAGYAGSAGGAGPSGFLAGVSAGVGVQVWRVNVDAYASQSIARAGLRDEGLLAFVRLTLAI